MYQRNAREGITIRRLKWYAASGLRWRRLLRAARVGIYRLKRWLTTVKPTSCPISQTLLPNKKTATKLKGFGLPGKPVKKGKVMPLIKGAKPGSPGFKKNIAVEAKTKPIKQAVAIAYSEARSKKKKGK